MDRPSICISAPAGASALPPGKGWRDVAADLARSGNPDVAQIGTVLCAIGAEVASATATAPSAQDWLNSGQLCEELGIGARTLERWCKRKLIPFVKRGRVRRFFLPDVNAALRANGLLERVTSVTATSRRVAA
jgi:excisionase family DNA binding protein